MLINKGQAVGAVADATVTALEKTGLKSKAAVDWNDPELYTRGGGAAGGSYMGPSGGDAGIRGLPNQQASLFEKKKKKARRKPGEPGGAFKDEEESSDEAEGGAAGQAAAVPVPTPSAVAAAKPKFDYAAAKREAEAAQLGGGGGGGGADGEASDTKGATREEEERVKKTPLELESSLEWRAVEGLTRGGGVRMQPTDAELGEKGPWLLHCV